MGKRKLTNAILSNNIGDVVVDRSSFTVSQRTPHFFNLGYNRWEVIMSKSKYKNLLKDPRWQKKRLEILDRDGWQCRCCFEDKETLHVHHISYEKDKKPWEYHDSTLITLCEQCHEYEHQLLTLASVGIHLNVMGI